MTIRRIHAVIIVSLAVFFAALGGVAIPTHADAAASLYLNPSGGTFEVGSTFTVSITLNTGGQAINAVEAGLRFPPDKLQIVASAPNEQSIMRIWVKPPTYSNADGAVRLQGAIPNPGVDTSSGLVSVLTFRVREAGVAEVKFTDDSRVFLNDGQATNILTKTTGGIYTLTVPPPQGPFVVSRTNPDQGRWYRSEFVQFEWSPPLDIEGYSYALDDDFDGSPDDVSEGTSTRIVYNNLSDGVYYFHIRALRQNVWGGVTTYGVKIDRTEPARFSPDILPDKVTSTRTPIVMFDTTDNLSGVDHYELAVFDLDESGSGRATPLFIEVSAPYVLDLGIGSYQVAVRAYDKAGNYTQVQVPLRIVDRMLAVIGADGILVGGIYSLAWPYAVVIGLFVLLASFSILYVVWSMYAAFKRRRSALPQL
jgi:hypothetical protein